MLPVTGYLVLTIGKKLLFYYSIILFCLGCFLCIVAPNLQALIGQELFKVSEAAVFFHCARLFY